MGEWAEQQPHGFGTMYWADGRSYAGAWQHGKMQGQGAWHDTKGSSRIGAWQGGEYIARRHNNALYDWEKFLPHAQEQISEMLTDRPQLQTLWQKIENSPLRLWLLQQFAGKDLQAPVFWQNAASAQFQIPPRINALHRSPSPAHDAALWVKDSLSPEESWACIVFELFNLQNAPDFAQINQDVRLSKCSESDFIERYAQLEYKALQNLRIFYREQWLPQLQPYTVPADEAQFWAIYLPEDYSTWRSQFKDSSGYPYHPYRLYYQQQLQNSAKKY